MDEQPTPPKLRMGFENLPAQQQARVGECLWDAHAAVSKILEMTAGGSFEKFAEHQPLQEFVATMIGITRDALRELERIDPAEADAIRDVRATIAFADSITAHAANPAAIWKFLSESLPTLLMEISERLEQWHQA